MDRQDFTVGWICAVKTEFVAACELLDEEYPPLKTIPSHDTNSYTLGRMGDHHVVVACLPKGRYGIASAATVAKDMFRSFESIRIGLMVGIGGGAPSKKHDIRLGDVVVACPVGRTGGVLPYSFGKAVQGKDFEITGSLNSPPTFLLTALNQLDTLHERKGHRIAYTIQEMLTRNPSLREKYEYPGAEKDRWYESSFVHVDSDVGCDIGCGCTFPPVIQRQQRSSGATNPVVHYGIIASADQLMKDAVVRDRISQQHRVLCFEMEATGLSNDFPCVVIRGICDYSDSHKNDQWQGYAAATAASYAKELLQALPTNMVSGSQHATNVFSNPGSNNFHVQFQLTGLPVAGHFVDRDAEIEEIKVNLLPTEAQNRRKIHVLHGLGGAGKTQLAIAYARKHQHTYSAIVWVNGNSTDTVLQSLAGFARRAGISRATSLKGSAAQQAPEMMAEADAVLRWLALEGNPCWLMIFDNVDRDIESDDEDAQAYDITSFLPVADHGSVLITTRLSSLGEIGKSTEVARLNHNQALELLSSRSGMHSSSNDMTKLVKRLGYLALAVVQAGTYMRETKTGCSKYLDLYETSWSQLAAETPRLRDYANKSIQTTWMISYDRVRQSDPTAANFLQLWAYLDHQDVWYELFFRGREGWPECGWFQEMASSEIIFKRVMKSLLALSLIESHQQTESYSIHPVVHDWCAETICYGRDDLMSAALTIVAYAVPSELEVKYWLLQQRLLPHADQCVRQLDNSDELNRLGPVKSSEALHLLGYLYEAQSKYVEAEKLYQQVQDTTEKVFGPEHTSTLATVNNLSILYETRGKYAEAEKLYQRALDTAEKVFGPEHTSTLATVNNLGVLYRSQGKYAEAEKWFQRALDGKEKAYGPEHTITLDTVNNLGLLYTDQDKAQSKDEDFLIVPDYTKSVTEVYEDAFYALVHLEQTLNVLFDKTSVPNSGFAPVLPTKPRSNETSSRDHDLGFFPSIKGIPNHKQSWRITPPAEQRSVHASTSQQDPCICEE
ncbi:hypothetical protein EPUS_07069 [Endocarpon pusillum Z07020]|uniref:NB-ARC domain-containing protein n=1 Tax=Endocarpon pusillum (strain Z07020 / HMAS-L-300199) TaxID=1263415 RepID=U1GFE0_ENDPU|nr:uncharacterized protein EPUS_07069 [Endocarpon pusillum Z07020]ERF76362.1 hypothetical protein EPUS_07069 [Endocarpon pusillum Z07020]